MERGVTIPAGWDVDPVQIRVNAVLTNCPYVAIPKAGGPEYFMRWPEAQARARAFAAAGIHAVAVDLRAKRMEMMPA